MIARCRWRTGWAKRARGFEDRAERAVMAGRIGNWRAGRAVAQGGRWKRPSVCEAACGVWKKIAEFQAIQWMIADMQTEDRSSAGAGALRGYGCERCASYEGGCKCFQGKLLRERNG